MEYLKKADKTAASGEERVVDGEDPVVSASVREPNPDLDVLTPALRRRLSLPVRTERLPGRRLAVRPFARHVALVEVVESVLLVDVDLDCDVVRLP